VTAYCVIQLPQTLISSALVWQDPLWRFSCVTQGPIPGFAHLESRRHIPFITELDGPEAATLGTVLARVTHALREAADAEKVYVTSLATTSRTCISISPRTVPGTACAAVPGYLTPRRQTWTWQHIKPSQQQSAAH
jgi:hypothetical protein